MVCALNTRPSTVDAELRGGVRGAVVCCRLGKLAGLEQSRMPLHDGSQYETESLQIMFVMRTCFKIRLAKGSVLRRRGDSKLIEYLLQITSYT